MSFRAVGTAFFANLDILIPPPCNAGFFRRFSVTGYIPNHQKHSPFPALLQNPATDKHIFSDKGTLIVNFQKKLCPLP
ncbi:hypothetical protein EG028_04195 [Chitinophaga barathri]|uniref:Uncharacterized protein n=1 Tax=Chitinophaga barathri TaxID=1647451 RepID=A0A3N4MG35_9BACT|nr:hypothetical protein EG028_04195 [Chitinophaga barathri]